MDAATPLGAILIDISLREHHAVLDAVRQWGLLMALTTILIACTTAYFLAAVITRPLQRLAHGMRAVAEGIPAPPLDEGGCCEVRQMAKSFNGMARSLQRRLAEMESLRTLGSAVSRSLDLGTVIKSANQCIEAAIPGTRAQIWLCDHEGGHLIEGGRSAVDAEQVIDLESDTVLARALKSPVPLLAGADSEVPLDPWLAERYEATSVAAVPLRAGQERVGVLLACRQKGAPLTRANLPFLEAAGTEIALSIQNARMFHRESHVAQVFQRMLLPQTHTFIEQLEVAVRWRPASGNGQIGGDYYDFIALPGGRWGIVIGDVCGKGHARRVLYGHGKVCSPLVCLRDRVARRDPAAHQRRALRAAQQHGGARGRSQLHHHALRSLRAIHRPVGLLPRGPSPGHAGTRELACCDHPRPRRAAGGRGARCHLPGGCARPGARRFPGALHRWSGGGGTQ